MSETLSVAQRIDRKLSDRGCISTWIDRDLGVPLPQSKRWVKLTALGLQNLRNPNGRFAKSKSSRHWRLDFFKQMYGGSAIVSAVIIEGTNLNDRNSNHRSIKGMLRVMRKFLASGRLPSFARAKQT